MKARSIAKVDGPLRECIRHLVSGASLWPAFLWGDTGTGKTCVALCLADHVPGSIYHGVTDLCDQLTQSQFGRLEWSHQGRGGTIWPEQFWARLVKAPLVILDELGLRETVSDAHYEAVKRLVDYREGRPLMVISNLPLDRLVAIYDARTVSRLGAGTTFEVKGPDRRLQ